MIEVGVRTVAATAAGALVLLLGSYGVGYLKGSSSARANVPVAAPAPLIQKSTDDKKIDKKAETKTASTQDVVADSVVTKTRKHIKLPDGSDQTVTVSHSRVATKEDIQSTSQTAAQVQVVEKLVTVPCPVAKVPASPAVGSETGPPKTRWMAGPSVARDFSLGKSVFGGSLARRVGPVWFRLFADSHPQAGLAVEVAW